jgi:uncharacterized protein YcbK (DUF882 family)
LAKLTEHFDGGEFMVSASHQDLADKLFLSEQERNNCYMLCVFILELIREHFGMTRILSGKRSPELNAAVGGVEDSQHLDATAVDFVCPGCETMEGPFDFICKSLEWPGEVIWYRKLNFVHVALPRFGTVANHFIKE